MATNLPQPTEEAQAAAIAQIDKLVKDFIDPENPNDQAALERNFYNNLKDIRYFDNLINNLTTAYTNQNISNHIHLDSMRFIHLLVNDESARDALYNLNFDSFESGILYQLHSKISHIKNFTIFEDTLHSHNQDIYNSKFEDFEKKLLNEITKKDFINVIKETTIEDSDFKDKIDTILAKFFQDKFNNDKEFSAQTLNHVASEAKGYFLSFFQYMREEDFFIWREKILKASDRNEVTEVMSDMINVMNKQFAVLGKENSNPFKITKDDNGETKFEFSEGKKGDVDIIHGTRDSIIGRSVTSSDNIGHESDQIFRHPVKVYLINKELDSYIAQNNININDFIVNEAEENLLNPVIYPKITILKELIDKPNKSKTETAILEDIINIAQMNNEQTYTHFKKYISNDEDLKKYIGVDDIEKLFEDPAFEYHFDQFSKSITKKDLNEFENQSLIYAYLEGQKADFEINIAFDAISLLFDKINMGFLYIDNYKKDEAEKFIDMLANDFFDLMEDETIVDEKTMINALKELKYQNSDSNKYSEKYLNEFLKYKQNNRLYMTLILSQRALDDKFNINTNEKWVEKFTDIIGHKATAHIYIHVKKQLIQNGVDFEKDMNKNTEEEIRKSINIVKTSILPYFMNNQDELQNLMVIDNIIDFNNFYKNILSQPQYTTTISKLINNNDFLNLLSQINSQEFLKFMAVSEVKIANVNESDTKEIVVILCNELVNNRDIMADIKKKIIQKLKSEEPINKEDLFDILNDLKTNNTTKKTVDNITRIYEGAVKGKNDNGKSSSQVK